MNPGDTIVAFDLETIPDADLLRKEHGQPDAGDDRIIEHALAAQLEKTDGRSDFLPVVFHRIVTLSIVMRSGDNFIIDSKAYPKHDEHEIVQGFFTLLERRSPVLVSWNGNGFDLPVLRLRAMRHLVVGANYWQGPGDRFNQYTSRYHGAHQDVMDILAGYQNRSFSSLQSAALACGLPGKMGYSGDQVLQMHRDERHDEIRRYCELDALTTYLVWLRQQLIAGKLPRKRFDEECTLAQSFLASSAEQHLLDYQAAWVLGGDSSASR